MTQNSFHLPPDEGCYLIHASHAIGGSGRNSAQHYIGWSKNIRKRFLGQKKGTSKSSALVSAFVKSGAKIHVTRIWPGANRMFEKRLHNNKLAKALCPVCNPQGWHKRAMKLHAEECADGLPFSVDLRERWPTAFVMEQRFRRFWPMGGVTSN